MSPVMTVLVWKRTGLLRWSLSSGARCATHWIAMTEMAMTSEGSHAPLVMHFVSYHCTHFLTN
jgi:hypothetical protein